MTLTLATAHRLSELRDRFIAVSMRTRSLRLVRCTRSGALDLSRLHATEPAIYAKIVKGIGHVSHAPIPLFDLKPSDSDLAAIASDLGTIARAARDTWLQTGAQELAVGWPFLEGRAADGTWLRAPLLLYPVAIDTTATGRHRWTITFLGTPDLNEALVQTLDRLGGVRLDLQAFLDADEDGIFTPDDETWGHLVATLQAAELPLSALGETLPQVEPLATRSREDRDGAVRDLFTLRHHVVVGRFPRSSSAIVNDYDTLLGEDGPDAGSLGCLDEILEVDEDAVWHPGTEDELGETVPLAGALEGLRRWQVLASDSSQDAVFTHLDSGDTRGLVVQGPPGTGKSQLISNLVAASVATGRRVLLVCPKRAALDVVKARLSSVGIGESIAVVHDVQRDRSRVCNTIAATLQAALATELEAGTDRSAELRDHEDTLARLDARLDLCQGAYRSLTDTSGEIPSLVDLELRSIRDDGRPLPNLEGLVDEVSRGDVATAIPHLDALSRETERLAAPHPLSHRSRWEQVSDPQLDQIFETLGEARRIVGALDGSEGSMSPHEAMEASVAWEDAAALLDLLESGDGEEMGRFVLFWGWTGGRAEHGEWHRVMQRLRKARKELLPTAFELILERRATVDMWLGELAELAELRKHWTRFFRPRFWRLRRLPAEILGRCRSLKGQALVQVDALCRRAIGWQDLIADLPSDAAFFDFGFQGLLEELDDAILGLATQHDRVRAVHGLHRALGERGAPYDRVPDLSNAVEGLGHVPLLRTAVADRHIARLSQRFGDVLHSLRPALEASFLRGLHHHVMAGEFSEAAEAIDAFVGARSEAVEARRLDQLTADQPAWVRTFLKGWRRRAPGDTGASEEALTALERAWMTLRLGGRDPHVLESPLVDLEQRDRLDRDLADCHAVAGAGIAARFRAGIAVAARGRDRGRALRKLAAEATKKRYRKSLRQLVDTYWDVGLSQVRPAWFCSPEAVGALFPLTPGLFDVVIFDEASQCPVESAIPALLRAQRVVIAGDHQQMPPSHFFRVSALDDDGDGDEESSVLASHSLLSLARVAFRGTTLQWHYRSVHEELVAFSNAVFYGNRLITAPRSHGAADPQREGMFWVRVGGLWRDQQNAVEAARVVDLVVELLTVAEGSEPPSVGVVTFNRNQATLIEALLSRRASTDPGFRRVLARERRRPAVEQLFVRNLENVQGDERDIIVFSVGYGPSRRGGDVHARFGPLSLEGGEKRLNVAITRAVLGIWVVASFDPEDLNVSKTKHRGPKMLREYLAFVRAQAQGDRAEALARLDAAKQLSGERDPIGLTTGGGGLGNAELRGSIGHALEAAGCVVETSVGLGSLRLDLAVSLPSNPAHRVGLDCGTYMGTADPLARDAYGPRFWRRAGWTVMRISPVMWRDRRDETVTQVLEELSSGPAPPVHGGPPPHGGQ